MSILLEEVIRQRAALERHILAEVRDFESRTGLSVRSGIELQHCHTIDGKSDVTSVSVRVELPES